MGRLSGILFFTIAALPYLSILFTATRGPSEPRGGAETLRVISPHRREVRLEYGRGFREWMARRHARNVEVVWIDVGGTTKIVKDLESRYLTRPDSPGVDVLFGGGVSPYHMASEKGWLLPANVPPDVLDGIPERCAASPLYDPGGFWYGVALSGFGILYNKPLLTALGLPPPAAWEDLAAPRFFSWVGSGDPRSSGSVHMCYEIILQAYGFERGWSVIARICANVRRFGEGGGVVPREVASGDVAAGMAIDQYAQTVINSVGADALAFVLPQGATVIDPDAIGVLKGAASPELARLFVEYTLSKEGQRLLYQPARSGGQVHPLFRLPVRAECYLDSDSPAARPYEFESSFRYDPAMDAQRRDVVNDLIGTVLIDAHGDLTAAWRAVIDSGMRPDLLAMLCAPPVTEEDIPRLSETWKDQRAKALAVRKISGQTTERYRNIAAQAGERGHK